PYAPPAAFGRLFRGRAPLGEILAALPTAPAGRPPKEIGSESAPINSTPPTLHELGIDKKTSSRAQRRRCDRSPLKKRRRIQSEALKPRQPVPAGDLIRRWWRPSWLL